MFKPLVIALALAATVPANASEVATRVVRFDDLNLANPAGMARLERRIDAAARIVCGYTSAQDMTAIDATGARACMIRAKAGAMAQVAAIAPARGTFAIR